MAGLSVERIQAPSRGLDGESANEYIDATHAPLVTGFVVGKNGKVTRVGRIDTVAYASPPLTAGIRGLWPFGNTASHENFITVAGGQTITFAGLDVGPVYITGSSGFINYALPSYTRVREFGYGVFEPPAGGYGICLLNPDTGVITQLFNAPTSARAVCNFNDRLFALVDEISGTAIQGPGLRWSDVGGAPFDLATDWQDDVTGLTNKIQMEGDPLDVGVALARVGRALVIFRRQSMYILTGDTPQSFNVQKISSFGCLDPGSVLEFGGGVFFLSDEGVCFYDGANVSVVSRSINELIPNVRAQASDPARRGCSATRLSQEYVLFNFSNLFAGSTFLLHVPTNSWSRISLENGGYLARSQDRPWVLTTNMQMTDLSTLTARDRVAEAVTVSPYGTSRPASSAILRTLRLGTPTNKARLHRVLVDYVNEIADGLSVSIEDEYGNVIMPTYALPAASTATPENGSRRQRAVIDCFAEVETVRLKFTSSPTTPTGVVEIHDTWVEYQAAQHRTG